MVQPGPTRTAARPQSAVNTSARPRPPADEKRPMSARQKRPAPGVGPDGMEDGAAGPSDTRPPDREERLLGVESDVMLPPGSAEGRSSSLLNTPTFVPPTPKGMQKFMELYYNDEEHHEDGEEDSRDADVIILVRLAFTSAPA
eukprot:1088482-Rhodomonas_salina.1